MATVFCTFESDILRIFSFEPPHPLATPCLPPPKDTSSPTGNPQDARTHFLPRDIVIKRCYQTLLPAHLLKKRQTDIIPVVSMGKLGPKMVRLSVQQEISLASVPVTLLTLTPASMKAVALSLRAAYTLPFQSQAKLNLNSPPKPRGAEEPFMPCSLPGLFHLMLKTQLPLWRRWPRPHAWPRPRTEPVCPSSILFPLHPYRQIPPHSVSLIMLTSPWGGRVLA